jgi:hypothetical protein
MTTEAQIEQSIRSNLSLIFGDSEAVEYGAFRQKYNALVDYAAAVTAPFLGAETIRYQTMLLYLSLLFLSISLFKIGNVKIGDTVVSVDSKLIVVYSVLILIVIAIFLVKAYVDYQRAHFVREKNQEVITELREMMSVGLLRKHIQEYFWLEIFDAIGRSYKAYDDAWRAATGSPAEFKLMSMQALTLDRARLAKIPETRADIERLDAYLAELTAQIANDEKHFRFASDSALKAPQSSDPFEDFSLPSSIKISDAFDQHLRKWFKVRNSLTDKHMDFVFEKAGKDHERVRLNAMVEVLQKIEPIRRIYVTLEIVAPVLFSIFCILYVRFR